VDVDLASGFANPQAVPPPPVCQGPSASKLAASSTPSSLHKLIQEQLLKSGAGTEPPVFVICTDRRRPAACPAQLVELPLPRPHRRRRRSHPEHLFDEIRRHPAAGSATGCIFLSLFSTPVTVTGVARRTIGCSWARGCDPSACPSARTQGPYRSTDLQISAISIISGTIPWLLPAGQRPSVRQQCSALPRRRAQQPRSTQPGASGRSRSGRSGALGSAQPGFAQLPPPRTAFLFLQAHLSRD
jgi:hypothetical protein